MWIGVALKAYPSYFDLPSEEDVSRSEPQSGELVDQYDVHEAACDFRAQSGH